MEISILYPSDIGSRFPKDPKILKFINQLDETKEYIVHINSSLEVVVYPKTPKTPIKSIETKDIVESKMENSSSKKYSLPFLYGRDKKNKERVWKIWVVNNTVYKSYGEVGGAEIPSTRTFKGVNIGKKNETTAQEQAKREAERDWIKQLDKGYHSKSKQGKELEKKILDAKKKQGGVNVNLDYLIRDRPPPKTITKKEVVANLEMLKPMKCSVWELSPKCLKYFDFDNGVYIQPKLDGVRCLGRVHNGKVILTTNSGKEMVWLDHIREELLKMLTETYKDVILDGEIYAHVINGYGYYDKNKYIYVEDPEYELEVEERFQVISGAARPTRNEPHTLENQLCFHVFDIVDSTQTLTQDERFEILDGLFKNAGNKYPHIKRVETKLIYDPDEITEYHGKMAEQDYEGVVLRTRELTYEFKRSLKIRKHKDFMDKEFVIVGVECDEGVGEENFTWLCEGTVEIDDEQYEVSFKAKPKGTVGQRREWYTNADEYIGKELTVRYQDVGSDGVPRFPRGIAIRDYE